MINGRSTTYRVVRLSFFIPFLMLAGAATVAVLGVVAVSVSGCAPLQKRVPLRERTAPVTVQPAADVQQLPCVVVIDGDHVRIEPAGTFDPSRPVFCQ